jgi:N6-adenosine-specific RNA methylase IME4
VAVSEGTYQILPQLHADELARLTASIQERGVEVPIVVDEAGQIIDGHHRAMIADSLGVDYQKDTRRGLSEWEKRLLAITLNVDRRQLTDAQRVVVGRRIEPDIAERTRARQAHGMTAPGRNASAQLRGSVETRDEVATAVGLGSGDTYERGKKVITQVMLKAPEVAHEIMSGEKSLRDLRRVLNDKGREQALHAIAAPQPTDTAPVGPYRVILADPPWSYNQKSQRLNGTTDRHYPTMPTAEIAELPVSEVVADDALLLLWTTWPFMLDAMRVIEGWGFTYVTGLPWVKADAIGTDFEGTVRFKPNTGVGFWFRGSTEPLLLAKRGAPKRISMPYDGILSDRNIHSRKPTCVHAIAESFGGPCLELFARERRPGWAIAGHAVNEGRDIRDAICDLRDAAQTAGKLPG